MWLYVVKSKHCYHSGVIKILTFHQDQKYEPPACLSVHLHVAQKREIWNKQPIKRENTTFYTFSVQTICYQVFFLIYILQCKSASLIFFFFLFLFFFFWWLSDLFSSSFWGSRGFSSTTDIFGNIFTALKWKEIVRKNVP